MKHINNLSNLVLQALDDGVRDRRGFRAFLKRASWGTEELISYNGHLPLSRVLSADFHGEYPLILINYTPSASAELYKSDGWNDALRQARGVVFDYKGNIKALPFPRMNPIPPEVDKINWTKAEQKLDGHLIIGFSYMKPLQSVNILTTRGFWNSPSAIHAQELFYNKPKIPPNVTVLMELISPISKHRVDYGTRDELVYITARDLNGTEFNDNQNEKLANYLNLNRVQKFNGSSELLKHNLNCLKNFEGYVVMDSDGNRYKYKTAWFRQIPVR